MERILVIFNMPGLEMLDITVSGSIIIPEVADVSGFTELIAYNTKTRYIIPNSMIAYMECEDIDDGR